MAQHILIMAQHILPWHSIFYHGTAYSIKLFSQNFSSEWCIWPM